jgi:hypothetical protein
MMKNFVADEIVRCSNIPKGQGVQFEYAIVNGWPKMMMSYSSQSTHISTEVKPKTPSTIVITSTILSAGDMLGHVVFDLLFFSLPLARFQFAVQKSFARFEHLIFSPLAMWPWCAVGHHQR